MEINFERYRHYDQDIENAILGVILMEKSAMAKTIGLIQPEYFYSDTGQQTYGVLVEMFNASVPIDLLTVTDYLINQKKITTFVNGDHVAYSLCRITNNVVSGAHLEYHCYILKQQWQRRCVLKAKYGALVEDGVNPLLDVENLNKQLQNILGGTTKRDWVPLDEAIFELVKHQQDMANGKANIVTTGIKQLDKVNRGFSAGDMVVIAARPGVGKSALMGRMALQMASEGKKVGIITLEMSNVQITARMAAIETDTEFSKVYWGMMEDMEQFRVFYDKISKQTVHLPIYLSEKARVNISEIRAKAIKLKASYGCDVLFIDYLQLIEGQSSNRNTNREQEVSQMSRGIKVMAKELEIPVIALAQLNREVAKRSHAQRLPMLTDLRESGSIEQDADVVMFLHSDFHAGYEVNEQGQSTKEEADLIVRKWRNGSHPHIKLGFDPPKMKFYEKWLHEQPKEVPKNGAWRPVDYSSPKEIDDENPF